MNRRVQAAGWVNRRRLLPLANDRTLPSALLFLPAAIAAAQEERAFVVSFKLVRGSLIGCASRRPACSGCRSRACSPIRTRGIGGAGDGEVPRMGDTDPATEFALLTD